MSLFVLFALCSFKVQVWLNSAWNTASMLRKRMSFASCISCLFLSFLVVSSAELNWHFEMYSFEPKINIIECYLKVDSADEVVRQFAFSYSSQQVFIVFQNISYYWFFLRWHCRRITHWVKSQSMSCFHLYLYSSD